MWKEIKAFVDRLGAGPGDQDLEENELRLASAALLVHAVMIDGQADKVEFDRLEAVLSQHFDLSSEETRQLIAQARIEEEDSVDLYRFTSVIKRHLDRGGRRQIVELLWEIVFADGVEHEFESNLVWRTAELLGIDSPDRIALKQKVRDRLNN